VTNKKVIETKDFILLFHTRMGTF